MCDLEKTELTDWTSTKQEYFPSTAASHLQNKGPVGASLYNVQYSPQSKYKYKYQ